MQTNIDNQIATFNNYVDQILPNFDPLTPLERTIVAILHDTYPLSLEQGWAFYWFPSPLFLRSYWMTPYTDLVDVEKCVDKKH